MAFPVILINSATGSDTAASGAGPGTAITGLVGRTRNTASQLRFGFFSATDDFSGVAVDGSHVLYMAIGTAGQRNFSSIAAIKNTKQDGADAAITASTAVLVVGSTTGWSVGDVIKVVGAGAASADLYSTILTVDSGIQATLNDNAGTTVSNANWENPKQATLTTGQGVNTGVTNTSWAIGGKRASIGNTNSRRLCNNNGGAGDSMPGWIVEAESGHSETLSSTLTLKRVGTSAGPILFRGTLGAATRPIFTFSSANGFIFGNQFQVFANFEVRCTNGSPGAAFANDATDTSGCGLYNIKCDNNSFAQFYYQSGWTRFKTFAYCSIKVTNIGIVMNDSGDRSCSILFNTIRGCGNRGIDIGNGTNVNNYAVLIGNIIANNGSDGIRMGSFYQNACNIIGNTFAGNAGDGIEIIGGAPNIDGIVNNIFSENSGYGINFSGSPTIEALRAIPMLIRNNGFYSNTSGKYNPSTLGTSGISFNEIIPTGDPFVNKTAGDYALDNVAGEGAVLRAAGLLGIFPDGLTTGYIDIGAAQHQDAGGGGVSGHQAAIFGA